MALEPKQQVWQVLPAAAIHSAGLPCPAASLQYMVHAAAGAASLWGGEADLSVHMTLLQTLWPSTTLGEGLSQEFGACAIW